MTAAQTATSGAAIPRNPAPGDYFSRAIPEPTRILGLKMRPLSIGRYRLLNRFNNAFVAEDSARAGIEDLLMGVVICSMRVDDFLEFSTSKHFEKEIARWSRRVFPHPWICALPFIGPWWRRTRGFNVVEKMQMFQDYIEAAQKIPRYTMNHNSPQKNTSHWSHSIEICLRSELGWTSEEINEAPLSKALADYFRYAESNDLVTLYTDEDLIAAEHNASRIEAALAGMNKENN